MSLAACIQKAGKALSKSDADIVRGIHADYVSDGMTSTEAAKKAIDDYLNILDTDRNDILQQIKKQGGDTRAIDSEPRRTKLSELQEIEAAETAKQTAARVASEKAALAAKLAAVDARYKDLKTRFNLDREEVDSIDNDPSGYDAKAARYKAVKAAKEVKPGEIRTALSKMGVFGRRKMLRTMPRRALIDFLPQSLKALGKEHELANDRWSGKKAELENMVGEVADDWYKLHRANPEQGVRMADLMHETTLAGVDPSRSFRAGIDVEKETKKLVALKLKKASQTDIKKVEEKLIKEKIRRGAYLTLKKQFAQLDKPFQEMYARVRDFNDQFFDRTMEALEADVEAAGVMSSQKSQLKAMVRQRHESNRIEGPFFHLGRSGEFFAGAKRGDELIAYERFETPVEREAWLEIWKDDPTVVTSIGQVTDNGRNNINNVDPEFVRQVEDLLGAGHDELKDKMWQMYLKTLPAMSGRRSQLHRKGRLGFSEDALQSFTMHSFRVAHTIAQLEHARAAESTLKELDKKARLSNVDDIWAIDVVGEMEARHEYTMNPPDDVIVANIMAFGFHWFLGGNLSTALVNGTQTWILGPAILGAAAGGGPANVARAAAALGRASAEVLAGKFRKNGIEFSLDEQELQEELLRVSAYEQTRAQDAIGMSNKGVGYFSTWKQFSELSAYMFHNVEYYNRQVTALAAYRMAREQSEHPQAADDVTVSIVDGERVVNWKSPEIKAAHDKAVIEAHHLTLDVHYDYKNTSRPPIMQDGWGRVAFMFMNYSVNTGYRLGRDFNDSLRKGDRTPQQQREARTRIVGILLSVGLASGIRGMPFIWAAMGVAAMFGDDDDEPFDHEGALRSYLTEVTGSKTASQFLMDGPIDALTGMSVADRVGLSNLVYRDVPSELGATEAVPHLLKELSGAFFGGFIPDLASAYEDYSEGRPDLAVKYLTPKAVANFLKSHTYATEGMEKRDGTVVFEPSDFDTFDLAHQAIGFGTTQVRLEYKRSGIAYSAEKKLTNRKALLRKRYINAEEQGDEEALAEVKRDIDIYDSKQTDPKDKLKWRSIFSAKRARRTNIRRSDRGIPQRDRERVESITNF